VKNAKLSHLKMLNTQNIEVQEHLNLLGPDLRNASPDMPTRTVQWQDKILGANPGYATPLGMAVVGDSLDLLSALPPNSVNLVVTSPPYALHFKKAYGNVEKDTYVDWFLPFAKEIYRILTADGSFVLNIGGSYNKGSPTKSLYQFHLLIALVEKVGFHLAQDCFWYNPAKMPVPAEWVTIRRIRIKDSVEYVWWLSKSQNPKASNRRVLKEYSPDMLRLAERGRIATLRPSGHVINESWKNAKAQGAIPPNVIESGSDPIPDSMLRMGNNSANDKYTLRCKEKKTIIHPARFPAALPEFFIKLTTEPNDLVVDPFSGSNTTGAVCEKLGRRWKSFELDEEYVRGSLYRF
jgi:site-specific DNA-methyltransferase (cytosine-N4-specific)